MRGDEKIADIGMVGMSHKTAPLELRERFALGEVQMDGLLDRACAQGLDEIVCISTCNRVEIYFASHDLKAALEAAIGILEAASSLKREAFEDNLYRRYARDAVLHLLGVASSLDSMVVGENEILFQVKNCYGKSVRAKRTGAVLNKLFHQAFRTAKRVRAETEITRNPLSIAYIATELAGKIFEDLSRHRALLIGAGEMGELILKYFTKYRVGDITIANRSLHNAQRIASEINREAGIVPLEEVPRVAVESDIIIASASSPDYLIDIESARGILRQRANRPLFIIDISVPRSVDPRIGGLSGVFLYNIDDLKTIADENLKNRLREVELAKSLVQSDTDEFMAWYGRLSLVPAIVRIKDKFDGIRKGELSRYRRRKLKHLSDGDFKIIEELTRQIMTKTLHTPISRLKRGNGEGSADGGKEEAKETARLIEELFKE